VTFAEALAELGIDFSAGPDQARRAYLRLLKTRKPEVDPSGFMRLREAYELVKPHLAMLERMRAEAAAEAEAETAEPPAPAPEPTASAIVEPQAPEPEATASEAMAPESAEPQAPAPDPITPQSAAPDPITPQATEPPHPPSEPEAPGAVSEPPTAIPSGQPGAPAPGRAQASSPPEAIAPPPAPPEAIAPPPPAAPDPSPAPPAPSEDDGFPARARALAHRFDLARLDATVEAPSLFETQHLLLVLHTLAELDGARLLFDAASGWLRASGQEARLLRGDAAAMWAVTRELRALPDAFSQEIRAILARAAVAGDFAVVSDELAAYRQRRPSAAQESAAHLRNRAPTLAAAVADVLDPPARAPAPAARSARGSQWMWALAVVAMGLVRVFAASSSHSSSPSSFDPSRFPTPRFDPARVAFSFDAGAPLELVFKLEALERVQRIRAHLDYALGDAGPRQKRFLAASACAAQIEKAIGGGDCPTARRRAAEMRLFFTSDGGLAPDLDGGDQSVSLDSALQNYCVALSVRTGSPADLTP
jgi:hypothetical protein